MGPAGAGRPPEDLPPGCLRVLVVRDTGGRPVPDGWDLGIRWGGGEVPPRDRPWRGWLAVSDARALFAAAEIRAREGRFAALEESIAAGGLDVELDASVVICTHRPVEPLAEAVLSAVRQELEGGSHEVVLVNNRPGDPVLDAAIGEILERAEAERPGILRVVHCPVAGLSHARNTGVAMARGAVLLFLDDDAVAPPRWVDTAVGLFRDHPETGVIGGHIRLVPPEPRPEVLQPGWERYWSQFLTGHEAYTEVENWWEYPWGASWCARRSVLLEIGGFRCRYGRVGNDFSGGEEVIAAVLAARLGHRIAVAPELEVEHRVVPERYTWEHVRRTIVAGTLVNYQAQRDLYLPLWEGPASTLRRLLSPSVDRTVGADTLVARLRHWYYRKVAWTRLLRSQLGDRRGRRKQRCTGNLA